MTPTEILINQSSGVYVVGATDLTVAEEVTIPAR
jgi:hypothetical protein